MKNIHLIQTDKLSRLVLDTVNNNLFLTTTEDFGTDIMKFQNIYIINLEKPKDGDWCIMFNDFGDRYVVQVTQVLKNNEFEVKLNSSPFNLNTSTRNKLEKIILTTDEQLIADGVQAIDDEFLQWFVKNPSCESVEVEKDEFYSKKAFIEGKDAITYKYKIIIPRKSKQETNKTHYLDELTNMDKDVLLKMWDTAMPKQETLEEAAESLFPDSSIQKRIFIKGVKSDAARDYWFSKWQQEHRQEVGHSVQVEVLEHYIGQNVLDAVDLIQFLSMNQEFNGYGSVSKETAKHFLEQYKKSKQ
jgi:hypothetical protein